MQSSPWDRGRMKTADYTSLRMAFAMHVAVVETDAPRVRAQLAQAIAENDVFTVTTLEAQRKEALNVQIIMTVALGRHLGSIGPGPIALGGPALEYVHEITAG